MSKVKTTILVILGLVVISSVISSFQASQPEAIAQRAKNAEIVKQNNEVRAANAAELSGEKCKKDGQAYIGELQTRTLKCGWGKPQSINRTINANVTREQWVYGSRNYLYFTDGVLQSIQN